MISSLKNSIFLSLFVLFQVLFAVYNKSGVELILISLYLFFLLVFFHLFKLKIRINLTIFFIWMGFLLLLLVSSIFSISKPLSLETLIFYIASFCTYTFFRSLSSSNQVSRSDIVLSLLGSGLVMSILFIIFIVHQSNPLFDHSMNLISYIYGHSHLASILLLLIPLSWWYAFSKKIDVFRLGFSVAVLLTILFYIILVLTFGRFALFLSILQLPLLIKLNTNTKQKSFNKQLVFLGFFLAIALFSLVYLSFDEGSSCKIKNYDSQVCKPIHKDLRYLYFRKALSSFFEKPILGYGPGTYQLIPNQLDVSSEANPLFAHNVFLQIFAESGFFAGLVFIILITTIIKKMYLSRNSDKRDGHLNKYILIGVLSIFFNSLIDFDWNIFLVFQLSLILMALSFWNHNQKKQKYFKEIKLIWVVLILFVLVLGAANFVNRLMINDNNDSLAFSSFPYSYYQSEYFLNSDILSSTQKKHLYEIYANHPKAIRKQIESESDSELKRQLFEKLLAIDKKSLVYSEYYDFLLEEEDYKRLGEVAFEGLEYLDSAGDYGFVYDFERTNMMIEHLNKAAYFHLQKGEINTASKYYSKVLTFREWIFHNSDTSYLDSENINIENFGEFLSMLDVESANFGQNSSIVTDWYLDNLEDEISSYDISNSSHWVKFHSKREGEFWLSVSELFLSAYYGESNIDKKQDILGRWYQYWRNFVENENIASDLGREFQFKLMNRLFYLDQNGEAEVIQDYLYDQKLP